METNWCESQIGGDSMKADGIAADFGSVFDISSILLFEPELWFCVAFVDDVGESILKLLNKFN